MISTWYNDDAWHMANTITVILLIRISKIGLLNVIFYLIHFRKRFAPKKKKSSENKVKLTIFIWWFLEWDAFVISLKKIKIRLVCALIWKSVIKRSSNMILKNNELFLLWWRDSIFSTNRRNGCSDLQRHLEFFFFFFPPCHPIKYTLLFSFILLYSYCRNGM